MKNYLTKSVLGLSILITVFLLLSCQQKKTEGNAKGNKTPNIILIMCDDLGWGDTGFNGNEIIKTPNLDALAAKGITFGRFYSASAVCSPTRASCLTGRNPQRLGIPSANTGHLKEQEITLPELLKQKGYATGHFGKWHLGTLTTKVKDANRGKPGDSTHYSIPSMHGYDEYFVTESKVPTYDPMLKPAVFDEENGESLHYGWKAMTDKSEAQNYGTYYWKGEEQPASENLDSDDAKVILDRVIPFIEKSVQDENPFFSAVWIHTPHLPVVATEEMMADYSEYSYKEQLYYAAISGMDKQIGRLWKKLEELGEADNTMIWFCSDNGPERDTPGTAGIYRERKRSLYEGGVRVPAFCVYPNAVKPGQKTAFPSFTSDYLPTIVDMLKLDFPDERPIDGVSLTSVLNGKADVREKPMGFQFGGKMSWVTQEYKLISTDKAKTFELYNLLSDPGESKNIIAENPELAEKMKVDLLAWVESCKQSEKGNDY
ncbi:sulfatase-like hydrolase/transferase [Flavivirga sp. 57AJ16]|uniref:sulfatase-like hydrolase/transferase n=1 Tax=Flavivirga sp. 57AJ16 TaxID=3025307 RepID=UPI00236523C7|nr:sulfatase-like hydrolase/transferase [Flavivirga sp. 57AJ16]MDD7885442.1 sulfatase-like hydrolase/transferase [Flavivirga sp. 57AJ16]